MVRLSIDAPPSVVICCVISFALRKIRGDRANDSSTRNLIEIL